MSTLTVTAGRDAHVIQNKPGRAFGGPDRLRVQSSEAIAYFRLPVHNADLPDDATVQQVLLNVKQDGDMSGTVELTARRVERWLARKVTWNTRPDAVADSSAIQVSKTDSSDGTVWTFDVTADYIAWTTGEEPNYGWRIMSDSPTRYFLHGFSAKRQALRPWVDIVYVTVPAVGVDLTPSFAPVSVAKPLLTWTGTGFDEVRVQIDSTGLFTTPEFDSGWVAETAPKFDLGPTAYAGFGATETPWRVNLRNSNGESGWSDPANASYVALPAVTVTNPGATVYDPTPPTTWTLSAGTQTHRQVIYTDTLSGRVLHDSGWSATSDQSYTPPAGLSAPGQATVTVRAVDDTERESIPGAPAYAEGSQTYSYVYQAGIGAVDFLTATKHATLPAVVLTWGRSTMPDEWVILRDGQIITWHLVGDDGQARFDGADLEESTGIYRWTDYYVPGHRSHAYEVRPVVNGEIGDTGPSATIKPEWAGVWLVEPDEGLWVALQGRSAASGLSYRESTTVHTPIGKPSVAVSHGMRGLEGPVSGLLDERAGRTWVEQEADLLAMKRDPAGLYRLVFGDLNIPVTIYDVSPTPADDTLPHAWRQSVSFGVLQQGEMPWDDG